MRQKLNRLLANIALLCASALVTFGVLEFVVFRQILLPDDVLPNVTIDGVVRYLPGTRAVFRHPDGSTSTVNINADGWNATRESYQHERKTGTRRIAVIGDSYVHGAFVETRQGFPEVMERNLIARGHEAEVLRFGMDGAPLSQYLHMLRSVVVPTRPDIVVVQLIHNDFDESFRMLGTRYNSSFMKLARTADGHIQEIAPTPFRNGWADVLRNSATFRYVYYETGLYIHLKSFVTRWVWGKEQDWSPENISSAVDIRNLKDADMIRATTDYVIAEMVRLSNTHGFRLVLSMDAVREAIYEEKDPSGYEISMLNDLVRELALKHGVSLVELQDTFTAHYARNHERFEFDYDWHWNGFANALIADAIIERLDLLGLLRPEGEWMKTPSLRGPVTTQVDPNTAGFPVGKVAPAYSQVTAQ